jgi:hypothetical protein
MPRYITIAEVNTMLGISGEDTLISQLIDGAESIFDGLIGSETGLITSAKTEDFAINNPNQPREKRNRVFYLGTYKPTAITTINGASPGTANVDYTLSGNVLEFKDAQTPPTTFPYRFRIVYTSGFADINAIPPDIKAAIKTITAAFYNTKNAQGIASFRQDLLSVNYKDGSILDTIIDPASKNIVQATVARYTVYDFYA